MASVFCLPLSPSLSQQIHRDLMIFLSSVILSKVMDFLCCVSVCESGRAQRKWRQREKLNHSMQASQVTYRLGLGDCVTVLVECIIADSVLQANNFDRNKSLAMYGGFWKRV